MDQDCAQPCAGPRCPAVRASERAVFGLLVFAFICGLGVLAALVPVGHGFVPKGGGWFTPAVVVGRCHSPLLSPRSREGLATVIASSPGHMIRLGAGRPEGLRPGYWGRAEGLFVW